MRGNANPAMPARQRRPSAQPPRVAAEGIARERRAKRGTKGGPASTRLYTSLDTTQSTCTHPADPEWVHGFRHGVAAELEPHWRKRAHRMRQCGEAAVQMLCTACGQAHFFPVRCCGRTCPTCSRRGAAAMADRLLERMVAHDLLMESEPWDGPGTPRTWVHGDPKGRGWKMVTLTSPAPSSESDRFHPDALAHSVQRVRKAIGRWWRTTEWGRQVRDTGSRRKRARRDTSYIATVEVAPGGMVHAHLLVYGEYIAQAELASAWADCLQLDEVIVDVRQVNPEDPAKGIREALKYATKGEGSRERQVSRAAAVERAFAGVRRVSIAGALRKVRGRSEDSSGEDVKPEDVHDETDAACEGCGTAGEWSWKGVRPHIVVASNGGWGAVRRPRPLRPTDLIRERPVQRLTRFPLAARAPANRNVVGSQRKPR